MLLQTDTLDRLPTGSHVVILRVRSLGDCVLSTPAISLLKSFRPDLEIGVVVEPRFAGVFEGNPAVSEILEPRVKAVRSFHPQLCLNLHGGTRSARLTLLSRARFRAGFDIFRPGWIYNTPIPTAQAVLGVNRRVHTAEHMAAALFYLGVPVAEVPRASLYPKQGRSAVAPGGTYAVFHPMASQPDKTWPRSFFLELAKHVSRNLGFEPLFIGGPGEDLSSFQMWKTISSASVQELARLMRDASLFVGNDSGPAHVAAAFGVPQVVFFGSSDLEIWHPWRTEYQVLAGKPIESISTDRAIQAVELLRVKCRVNV